MRFLLYLLVTYSGVTTVLSAVLLANTYSLRYPNGWAFVCDFWLIGGFMAAGAGALAMVSEAIAHIRWE